MAQCAILNLVWRQKEFVYFVLFQMQKDGFIIHTQLLASKLIKGIYEYDEKCDDDKWINWTNVSKFL